MSEKYSAGLMAQSFWFIEFKKIVQLIDEGKSKEEIKYACVDENLFGAQNPYRANRMFGYLFNRASCMDDDLRELFLNSDMSTQKIINLICVLLLDRLFFDFIYEVYRDKAFLGVDSITITDVNIFFRDKALQSDEVANWNDSTTRHLRNNYTGFMADAGLLEKDGAAFKITIPLLDFSLEMYLRSHNGEVMLKAITGVM